MENGEIVNTGPAKYFEWSIYLRTEEECKMSCKSPKVNFLDTSWYLEYVPQNYTCSIYLAKDHSQTSQYISVQIGENSRFCDGSLSRPALHRFTDKASSTLIADKIQMIFMMKDTYDNTFSKRISFCCLLKSIIAGSEEEDTEKLEYKCEHRLTQNFRDLLYSGEEVDVVLRVQSRDFKCHRAILVARSTVFAAMFKHDMKEKVSGVIQLEDCDPDIFEYFLQHLYTGSTELSHDIVIPLYEIADKYESPDLKENCVDCMSRMMSVQTFCDVVKFLLNYTESKLLDSAVDFFKKNVKKISLSVEWQSFIKGHPLIANKFNIIALGHHGMHE